MLTEKYLFEQIPSRTDLPTPPQLLLRLMEVCGNGNAGNADLSALVKMDPALYVKVLKLAWLPRSEDSGKGLDVTEAVAVVGTGAIRNIAIRASLHGSFEKAAQKPFVDLERFWLHSLHCAILARLLASQSGYPRPEEAYTAGLLHDLGRLVIWTQFHESMQDSGRLCWNTAERLHTIEDRLGVPHAKAGANVLRFSGFPSFLVDAVLYHHEPYPKIVQSLPLVKIVYAANEICRQKPAENDRFWSRLASIFSLSKNSLISASDLALQETSERVGRLNIHVGESPEGRLFIRENDATAGLGPMSVFHRGRSLLPESVLDLVNCEDQDGIVSALREWLQIFMDADRVLFFLPKEEKNCLCASCPAPNGRDFHQDEIELPLEFKKSVIVSAHTQLVALDSFSISFQRQSVILDEQIINFLDEDGIVCIPMVSRGVSEGVIVMPLDRSERFRFYFRMPLMELISAHAATAFRTIRLRLERNSRVEQDEEETMPLAVQKMLHEVSSPLTIVKNYLKVIGDKLSNEKPVMEELKIVEEETDRLASILSRIPSRAEIQPYELEAIDINGFLRDMVKVLKESFAGQPEIFFRLDLEENLPAVEADGNTLKQIFTNLFNNSAEAMPEGGTITVRTGRVSDDCFFPPGQVRSEKGAGVIRIVVQDDGVGIPEEMRARIFEPFVSSKPKPHSGLGLSIVHGMVTALGGTISCESTRNEGASLVILLPAKEI